MRIVPLRSLRPESSSRAEVTARNSGITSSDGNGRASTSANSYWTPVRATTTELGQRLNPKTGWPPIRIAISVRSKSVGQRSLEAWLNQGLHGKRPPHVPSARRFICTRGPLTCSALKTFSANRPDSRCPAVEVGTGSGPLAHPRRTSKPGIDHRMRDPPSAGTLSWGAPEASEKRATGPTPRRPASVHPERSARLLPLLGPDDLTFGQEGQVRIRGVQRPVVLE